MGRCQGALQIGFTYSSFVPSGPIGYPNSSSVSPGQRLPTLGSRVYPIQSQSHIYIPKGAERPRGTLRRLQREQYTAMPVLIWSPSSKTDWVLRNMSKPDDVLD